MINLDKQHPWIVLERLVDVVLYYVPGCIVEIGIGSSTEVLNTHSKNTGVKFYTCDTSLNKCKWRNL